VEAGGLVEAGVGAGGLGGSTLAGGAGVLGQEWRRPWGRERWSCPWPGSSGAAEGPSQGSPSSTPPSGSRPCSPSGLPLFFRSLLSTPRSSENPAAPSPSRCSPGASAALLPDFPSSRPQ